MKIYQYLGFQEKANYCWFFEGIQLVQYWGDVIENEKIQFRIWNFTTNAYKVWKIKTWLDIEKKKEKCFLYIYLYIHCGFLNKYL